MVTVSDDSEPATAPDPYRMVTSELREFEALNEEDFEESKSGVAGSQLVQSVLASQRSEEPVSRMTLKD
jgi:hypothetical protein